MTHSPLAALIVPTLTPLTVLALFTTALIGGALNSVAGGGSFFTFPTLIFTGVAPVTANATNTIALWPGSVASVGAYRNDFGKERALLAVLALSSFVGGIFGAFLLLRTSQSTFVTLIPYLLLLATALFALSPRLTSWLRQRSKGEATYSPAALVGLALIQLVIAVYGGYFGGGIGIMMLAALGLMGLTQIHQMNALKTVLASCINGVAVVIFIVARAVVWPQALVMIVGAIIGGYGGAYFARQIDPRFIRGFVILVGIALTIYFFIK